MSPPVREQKTPAGWRRAQPVMAMQCAGGPSHYKEAQQSGECDFSGGATDKKTPAMRAFNVVKRGGTNTRPHHELRCYHYSGPGCIATYDFGRGARRWRYTGRPFFARWITRRGCMHNRDGHVPPRAVMPPPVLRHIRAPPAPDVMHGDASKRVI